MAVAKVIQYGDTQAIQLPEASRVDASHVYLKRTREGFLILLRDPWELFIEGAEELSDGFMSEGRAQPEAERRE